MGEGSSEIRPAVGYSARYEVQQVMSDRVARPSLDIPKEQLEYLLAMGFSSPQISNAIGVSLSTVRRRMTRYGLTIGSLYSDVTDEELDSIVSEIKVLFPNYGFRMVIYLIKVIGFHKYVFENLYKGLTLMELLSGGVQLLNVGSTKYSLWHLDGYHKLIR